MNAEQQLNLQKNSLIYRKEILTMLNKAGSGHSGGSLGIIDVLNVLYEHILNYKPDNPHWHARDRFVLSAGHLCPALYVILADQGYFDIQELRTLRQLNSRLQGHPELGTLPGIENTSGPLGQGISVAVGKALAAKMKGQAHKVYCLTSDGEHNEGALWESLLFAAHHHLDNLCVIVDRNNIQIGGKTSQVLDTGDLKEKYESFGWNVIEIDGHNNELIYDAFEYVKHQQLGKPCCLIAHTQLGKGVSFMQNNPAWHGRAPRTEELTAALRELQRQEKALELQQNMKTKGVLP